MSPWVLMGLLIAAAGVLLAAWYKSQGPEAPPPPLSTQLAFARQFGPIAQQAAKALGQGAEVAAILVAWAAMESNYGTSKLATQANNLFGIKAGPTWKSEGKSYASYPTSEYIGGTKTAQTADFRRYGSWSESLSDLINLLRITTIYKPAYDALARADLTGFFQTINASGYSTAPNYAARIENFLKSYSNVA